MLKFSKMHGLGNDFIIIDAINQQVELSTADICFLADRHRGIGCDQLLLVEAATSTNADFKYRIFNADGDEVSQCGNGVRCFARFVCDNGLTDKMRIAVETESGIVFPSVKSNGDIEVDMGRPRFALEDIPFIAEQESNTYLLSVSATDDIEVSAVSVGNPHAVMIIDNINDADVARLGPIIESHERFPQRVNVGFMEIVSPTQINLRVYERGVGETQACGTGACAAVISGIRRGLLDREVRVRLSGGELIIGWPDDASSVLMTGPATHVFDGEIAWTTIHSH